MNTRYMLEASCSLILFPVGRGCKAQCSFRFPAAQAFKVEKGISVRDCQQTHRQHGRICSPLVPDFCFSAFMQACMRPFHQVPRGMRIFRGDLHIWKPASLLHALKRTHKYTVIPVQPCRRIQLIGCAPRCTIRECGSLIKTSRSEAAIHCLSTSPLVS